jgi:hypothetical protein
MKYKLVKAVEEVLKIENSRKSKFKRFGYEWELLQEILSAVLAWPFGAKELVDQRNWNIERLKDDRYIGGFRKPKAYFDVFITLKGNLAMDWYQVENRLINPDFGETDWKRWDYNWPIGGGNYNLPFNRVLMIRKFDTIDDRINDMGIFSDADAQLILTIYRLIDHIYHYLKEFIDVIELSKLNLLYDEKKNEKGGIDRIFTGFSIIDKSKTNLI